MEEAPQGVAGQNDDGSGLVRVGKPDLSPTNSGGHEASSACQAANGRIPTHPQMPEVGTHVVLGGVAVVEAGLLRQMTVGVESVEVEVEQVGDGDSRTPDVVRKSLQGQTSLTE